MYYDFIKRWCCVEDSLIEEQVKGQMRLLLTQVLRGAAGVFDQAVLQLGQMEVTDDDFGVLQPVVVH